MPDCAVDLLSPLLENSLWHSLCVSIEISEADVVVCFGGHALLRRSTEPC